MTGFRTHKLSVTASVRRQLTEEPRVCCAILITSDKEIAIWAEGQRVNTGISVPRARIVESADLVHGGKNPQVRLTRIIANG